MQKEFRRKPRRLEEVFFDEGHHRPPNYGPADSSPSQCGWTDHPDVRRIPTNSGTGPADCADR
uniref:Uncharacterized protein n=1 Tax=Glossina palpalis gambiensis TaxID=67801 RepID=A0A1B0BWW1_9MUSC